MFFRESSSKRAPDARSLDMHGEAFLKQRGLRAAEPSRPANALGADPRQAAQRRKRHAAIDEKTDEMEQQAGRPQPQTRRIAIHDALRCSDREIDADPATESGRRGVTRR